MENDTTPSDPPLDSLTALLGASQACPETANGWVWYCDVHDTHGNADSEDEARFMADFHDEYWRQNFENIYLSEPDYDQSDREPCDLAVTPRKPD